MRDEIDSAAAISLAERLRQQPQDLALAGVSNSAEPLASCAPCWICRSTSLASAGVMNIWPLRAARMAMTSSGGGRVLHHEAGGAGLQRAPRIGRVLMHRQEDNLDVGLSFFSCAIASIPLRCGIVMSATMTSGCSLGGSHQRTPVLDHADELEILGKEVLQSLADDTVIVTASSSVVGSLRSSRNGTQARIVVP